MGRGGGEEGNGGGNNVRISWRTALRVGGVLLSTATERRGGLRFCFGERRLSREVRCARMA